MTRDRKGFYIGFAAGVALLLAMVLLIWIAETSSAQVDGQSVGGTDFFVKLRLDADLCGVSDWGRLCPCWRQYQ